jgi:hypothetical protein
MFSDVESKLKKRNKILFSRDSPCLQELIGLIGQQHHRTLVLWALDCARSTLEEFEARYPDEDRPRTCLELCEAWAAGKIKMPAAKRAILDAHAVAKEIDDARYGSLCHAIGHAGATVHVETHAIGLPLYELTAIVMKNGASSFQEPVLEKMGFYIQRLSYWQDHADRIERDWAVFLRDDTCPNKEKALNEKRSRKAQG